MKKTFTFCVLVQSCRWSIYLYYIYRRGPLRAIIGQYPTTLFSGKRRAFQPKWYTDRPWLEYDMQKDAAFCFPCRVFGATKYDTKFQVEGFRNWEKALSLNRGLHRHATSSQHGVNITKWEESKAAKPIDVLLSEQRKMAMEKMEKEREARKNVLPLLHDITNTLARLRLPFRGHDESDKSSNKGTFLEITNLVARWNEELSTHLEAAHKNPKGYPSYTSPSSQNQMIHSTAEILRQDIVAQIVGAKYFAVCLDTTPDASKNEQLSFIVRFVTEDGSVVEALLDMLHIEKTDAASLYQHLRELLEKYGLDITHLRGQGYDGCASMSGKYTGLQARIKEVCPEAYYVHCFAHRLNLVIVDTCSINVNARNFFGIVEQLYAFIEGSTKRHGLFKQIQQDESELKSCGTLQSLSTTRWNSRASNCAVLEKTIVLVVKTLESIASDASYPRDTAATAIALRKAMDYEFCVCLATFSELLQVCDVVSKSLQRENIDISMATSLVEDLLDELKG